MHYGFDVTWNLVFLTYLVDLGYLAILHPIPRYFLLDSLVSIPILPDPILCLL